MLHPSTKKLIDRICEMTIQRKIDWVSGEQPDVLAYDTEGYRVLLDGNPAALSLCDALGNELERASQADIAATQHIDGGTYEAVVETMRADADRIARGTEGAIASVLGSLNLDTPSVLDEPAPLELEDAPNGPSDAISDQIEDPADETGTLSANMPEAFEDSVLQTDNHELEAPLEDTPLQDVYAEDSDGIEKAVANLADRVNNPASNETAPSSGDALSGAGQAALLGGAALGGAAFVQAETATKAEAELQTPAQTAGFISLSGLASGDNGFVTPVITETTPATENVATEMPPLNAETIEVAPAEIAEPATYQAEDAQDMPVAPIAPETIPEFTQEAISEIIPETVTHLEPQDTEATEEALAAPFDPPSDDLAAPIAPPAPEDAETELEAQIDTEEKPEKSPNKRFNPWI